MTRGKGKVIQCKWGFLYLLVEDRWISGERVEKVYVTAKRWSRNAIYGYYGMPTLDENGEDLCEEFRLR